MEKANCITRDYIRDFFRLTEENDKDVIDFIMARLVLKEFAHNSYICRAGDDADLMYFIDSGTVTVRGANNEVLNELQSGRYFGEYAALTGDKRLADIQARGTVQVYALDKETLISLARSHSGIYSRFLKNIYIQESERYRKLVRLLNSKRGFGHVGFKKKLTLSSLFLNYYVVFVIFYVVFLFAPNPALGPMHPFWLCSPVVFMVAYMVITKRALEALVLSPMYIMILLGKLNFAGLFYTQIIKTIMDTADIILIVMLMGSLTRLFSASGSINALKRIAQKKIKSAKGTMLAAFVSMVLIAIDEYLLILINGACFTNLADEKRIPREKSAMVMGMSPGALCILSPMSLNGIYLTGLIAMSSGQRGLFIEAIRYNFAAIVMVAVILLLALEKLPLVGALKKAAIRVREGGDLWPEGTDNPDEEEDSALQGRVRNLLLPVLILIVSSIIAGTLEAGEFQINVLYGMIITLICTFLLYCFQEYMSPDQFFKNVVYGIESMIAPVVMFLMGKCFANGMDEIGFSAWLDQLVQGLIRGQVWLLPLIIFGICTFVGALFDNPWAMYAIGMPIAVSFASSMHGNTALYVGAVCAAGLMGNEIAMGDIFFIGPMLGINPMRYYQAKLPYVIVIVVLAALAYASAGYWGL
ncbi:MAG: cyclic nucleotide-binding domain-containing protein [Treponema sp.]|jgi:Na+/H+ antiporter NhaC|nr:cyclic nucleotide-binding domain-containing protein [Treponema sp.]